MAQTPLKKGYYTTKEITEMLGVCRDTVWRYIRSGKLKAIKLTERNFRIEKKELERFLNKRSK